MVEALKTEVKMKNDKMGKKRNCSRWKKNIKCRYEFMHTPTHKHTHTSICILVERRKKIQLTNTSV